MNDRIGNGVFPNDLKLADVSPVFKKIFKNLKKSFKKENCRPISIIPHTSKVFGKIIYKQIDAFITAK